MAKRYSNFYIFRFALIMVVIVATLLSLAFALLKPYQDANIRIEKTQDILLAAGIDAPKDDAYNIYRDRLIAEVMINPEDGKQTSVWLPDETFVMGNERAFDVNMRHLVAAQNDFIENRSDFNPDVPLFLIRSKDNDTIFVIPVRGRGLWGPVWGNIALASDKNSIVGVTFDHQAETPGLGAEINLPSFQNRFEGKKLFDENGKFKSITVVKGGVETVPHDMRIHSVDGISGGTITSNGVSEMLHDRLSFYVEFLKNQK